MRPPSRASSTALKLCRNFISKYERPFVLLKCTRAASIPSTNWRPFSVHHRRCFGELSENRTRKNPLQRLPRNEEIKSWSITLVGEDGKLSEPRNTDEVLSSIDLKKQSLIVVAPGEPGSPPVCKIKDRNAEYKAMRAQKKNKKGPTAVKSLELNWGIDNHDLEHRLKKMQEFLGKGYKLEILCVPKRRSKRPVTVEEANALVARLKETIAGVDGSKETKAMEGEPLKQLTIFAEGRKAES